MTALRFAVPLILFTAACSPAWSDASVHLEQTAQPVTLVPAPVISVGVSDPNTQLILPWFLTDIINAINTRTSASDYLRTVGHGI
ncbi:hypothetical protein GNZ12_21995 [Paraburkholderia sp. 1N]|uniref:Uncharacterized protein n=1 Tax=Paraburkholderia solitsugae TaxID=2675748 RepID=A0ABX2BSR4_9BURK|nr:hypothetical protein [Paraburkholderia solitsugae]NPT43929.1 hypothetical protein [Paraburkholderia solitsugae]